MRKKFILRLFAILVLLFLIYAIIVIIHGSLTDYQPADKITLTPDQDSQQPVIADSLLSVLTWNVGYGGLGEESNFFYHGSGFATSGGKMVRPEQAVVEKNIEGATDILGRVKSDFTLLQEVDIDSKRSYFIDQYARYREQLPQQSATLAINFQVARVPAPILQPWSAYGQALSGLVSFSRFQPVESVRYQLPGKAGWPVHLFQLDRCILRQTFQLANGRRLHVLNIHNSAYDKNGSSKFQQLDFLKELILPLYEAGDYVLAGGDWNQSPPFFDNRLFPTFAAAQLDALQMPAELMPEGWNWIYDPTQPTVRSNVEIYDPNQSVVKLIDYFLISPNLKARTVKTLNEKFRFSDHQPVWMEFELM